MPGTTNRDAPSHSAALARLIGPVLVATTASEAFHLDMWRSRIPALTYLNGCLLLTAGLAIVRTHNVWTLRWPLVITLIGWLAIAGGLFRMFFPEQQPDALGPATLTVLGTVFAAGCVLTLQGLRSR